MSEEINREIRKVKMMASQMHPLDVKAVMEEIDRNIDVLSELFEEAYNAGGDECVSNLMNAIASIEDKPIEVKCGSKKFIVEQHGDKLRVTVVGEEEAS